MKWFVEMVNSVAEDDSDPSDCGEWEDGDYSDEEKSDAGDGPSDTASPRSHAPEHTFLLPSLWKNRPATIWFDYPDQRRIASRLSRGLRISGSFGHVVSSSTRWLATKAAGTIGSAEAGLL